MIGLTFVLNSHNRYRNWAKADEIAGVVREVRGASIGEEFRNEGDDRAANVLE